ncbi:MAG TPA: NIPSNAP family protein [Burkholderiales bacterium]|nr:NIPSNAP family protein [Burkholderiales bacterium]
MIYEVRTYDLKPRTVPEVEKRFAEAYEYRKKFSPLAAFWHTEFGPLNQIIHVWPYKDLEERARIRAEAVKDGNWPPKTGEFILRQQADIMMQFPFSPELKPGKLGPYFEMRIYQYPVGQLPLLQKCWQNALDVRLRFGPVCALWYSELGALSKFIHIWPYASLEQRNEIREKAHATGEWPPSVKAVKDGGKGYDLVSQENKLLLPSAFSPIQ